MRRLLALSFLLLLVMAQGPASVASFPTIAAMQALGTNSKFYGTINVLGYAAAGDGGGGIFQWNTTSTATTDGGTIFTATGVSTGRWLRQFTGAYHSKWFGVVADAGQSGTPTGTDQTTKVQALLTSAGASGNSNWVHIDGTNQKCIRINTQLQPTEGEIIEGDGEYNITTTVSTGTCISFEGSSGYIFQSQGVQTGSGTTPFEAPKYRDITLMYNNTTLSAGGCIQWNLISGGFTDTTGSQQYMFHPEARNVYCGMVAQGSSALIGLQCSKCIDGHTDGFTAIGGLNGIDLEGSENFSVKGGTVETTYGVPVLLISHNTFGNNDSVRDMQILSPYPGSQNVDAMIQDYARSSILENNFFENVGSAVLNTQIHLSGGFTATILGNQITLSNSSSCLHVTGIYNNIVMQGNGAYGALVGAPVFDNGNYLYNSVVRQTLFHSGNGQSCDESWPFNSRPPNDQTAVANVEQVWKPDYEGLTSAGYGLSEIPANGAFTFPVTGSTNYLELAQNSATPAVGTFDVSIRAWQTSGTGSITCQLEDNGTPAGSSISTGTITAHPQWYTLAFAQAISTSAWIKCWDTGGSSGGNPSMIGQINLVDH